MKTCKTCAYFHQYDLVNPSGGYFDGYCGCDIADEAPAQSRSAEMMRLMPLGVCSDWYCEAWEDAYPGDDAMVGLYLIDSYPGQTV